MITSNLLFYGCLLVCSLLSLNAGVGNSDPLGRICEKDTVYDTNNTAGRIYRTNLQDFLLPVLTSNASRPNGFYNFTVGSADPSNDTAIYGLFLCRGDVGTGDCQDCVKTASGEVLRFCPNYKIAVIWYDNCMLRYSNRSIFSTVDGDIGLTLISTQNVTDRALFSRVLADTLDRITNEAANENDVSGKKFAVGETNISTTTSQRIYGLGQCTPDLSSSDCGTCLRSAISRLPDYPQGGRVLLPSCNIRYEIYLFYQVSTPAPQAQPTSNLLPLPPLGPSTESSKDKKSISTGTILALVVPISVVIVVIVVVCCIARRARKAYNVVVEKNDSFNITTSAEFLRYNLSEIQAWTNDFVVDNRIGRGGFGDVFKGTLPNGQEMAVKRLSRSSAQGTQEFITEIELVAQLQHRNLVRLLGYCFEGEEKMLIYEFVPNKSLDYFLFDPERQPLLNWLTRYKIIGGIAKGLLYLHEESRLKIIHRDLKASNVLLDQNMNPKIADFGMARLFEVDQSEGNTSKIAGTFGYMSPEYAMHGLFSVKSDVFSFGVLVLEIISGNKNNKFLQSQNDDDLLSYAWRHWRDGTPLELLDPSIGDSYGRNEVIQCIHIGLLCVQDDVEQRPTMASVVLMLNTYSVTLPIPNPPPFSGRSRTESFLAKGFFAVTDSDKSSTNKSSVPDSSGNDASITELYPR